MNLGDLTNLVEKPLAAVSNIINTPNSAGRYRPLYLRNLLDAVQGRTLEEAVDAKTVLITGASSGIGEAAAKKIAEAGGVVALVARTRENLEKVASEIRENGGSAHVYPCDLSDMDAIAAMADRVLDDLGGVDILINNAGRSIRRSLELSYDRIHDYQRTMQLNYLGAVQLILKFIPGHARARLRPDHQRVVGRGADPRAAVRGVHRQQGRAGQPVRRAAGRSRQRQRQIHHRAHGAGAHPDDQPDHVVRQVPGADARAGGRGDRRRDRAPAAAGQLAVRAVRRRRRRGQPGRDGPGAQPGVRHVRRLQRRQGR
ncbi:hypothetical protein MAP_1254 [Mycobacterium avium subsp. paratuberculosis K-10]|uniref:Fatty acyl-CoA reductase n=1 Tax=Mycolicibacterium paratuberculosis (strain ATCC BAA-968 / K-10) TaxID=262316 RepID=Q740T8_MYCPA|nr:hypothetical protein MAP_1254 [Mycobacterium avium subsp. paratuberculosis K-10]